MDNIKDVERWILWKRNQAGAKVPCNRWAQIVSCMDSDCWVTFEAAKAAYDSHPLSFEGLAFVLTEDLPFIGIDLDDCCERYTIKPWAQPILKRFAHTYCELSPSLHGVKIFGQGHKPTNSRCTVPCGDGQIECYEHGRYFTWTGLHLGEFAQPVTECQEAIDWLYATYYPAVAAAKQLAISDVFGGSSFDDRIRGFLSACESQPIIEGQRNTRLHSIAKGLFDFEHHGGELLSLDQVTEIVLGVNSRLLAPLDETEVVRLCQSAERNGRARQPKLPQRVEQVAGVDISGILNQGRERPPEPRAATAPSPAEPFPAELLEAPGFVAEFVAQALASSLYPQPQLAFGAALALLSILTGRKLEDEYGTRTNLYIVCVSPTASGKDAYRAAIKQVLSEAGAVDLLGPESLASGAGLVSRLVVQPATLFPLDEFGRLMESVKHAGAKATHLHQIPSVLLQIYSSAGSIWQGSAYADATKNPVIDQPHAVIYGSSTAEAFWGSLNSRSLQDGLVGRLCPLFGEYVDLNEDARKYEPSSSVVEFARQLHQQGAGGNLGNVHPQAETLATSPAAQQRWLEHCRAIVARRKAEPPPAAAIWSRTAERSRKFAMLLAVSRCWQQQLRSIELCDMDLAIRLSNWSTRAMVRDFGCNVSDNQTEAELLRVLDVIRKKGGRVVHRDLVRTTKWLNNRRRKEVLLDLVEAERVTVETDGRTNWYAISNE